jgi:murein DD-endopeptidase MepM/ murein hydrolase activator NlpD
MLSKKNLLYISFFLLLLVIGIVGVYRFARSAAVPTPSAPQAQTAQEEEIRKAIQNELDTQKAEALPLLIYNTQIENVQVSADGSWATGWLVPLDPDTNQVVPVEPGLALVKRTDGTWKAFLPSDPLWTLAVREVPSDLIPPIEKIEWMQVAEFQPSAAPSAPLHGYYLPWSGGDPMVLTQSVGHDRYTPSGTAHFAFDFAKPGYPSGMFNVLAAKGGIVKRVVWTNPNGNESNANFIVLEDTTTSPTTYQLYMHLAQDSVPAALRVVGAPARQGQLVGIADDTGVSSGNHLHFMVHTTSTSYWGTSVDITFTDVSINGGRPRITSDKANCKSSDVCDTFQSTYVSGNFMVPDHIPPTGGIASPPQGSVVTSAILPLEGHAVDSGSGIASAQFIAKYGSNWKPVGGTFSNTSFSLNWDMCADKVPDGPVSLALVLKDKALNQASGLPGLTHFTKNVDCAIPVSACTPSASQVTLFSSADFQGDCIILDVGSHSSSAQLGKVGDDNASSILVGSNVLATLYSKSNLQGRSEAIFANDSNLADNHIGTDSTSSLLVQARTSQPGVPVLVSPENDASFPGDASLTLAWENGGAATQYQLHLTLDSSEILLTPWTSQSFWQLSALAPGSYTWQVKARNANSETGWTGARNLIITAPSQSEPLNAQAVSAPFSDGMENSASGWTDLNWTLTSEANHTPDGAMSWKYDNGSANGYDNGKPNAGYLTSPPINLPANGTYYLRFYYQYETEDAELNWDQRWLQISVDGGPFGNILQLSDDPPNYWLRAPLISLAQYAGRTVRIRFYFVTLDEASNQHKGWYIDDFSVTTDPPPTCNDNDNSFLQASLLNYNQSANGVICPGGDEDYYKFQGVVGNQVGIRTEAQSIGSPLDTQIYLIDADGRSVLSTNDDQVSSQRSDSNISYRLSRTGTYFIKVKAWDHPNTGDTNMIYTLRLYQESQDPVASFISPQEGAVLKSSTIPLSVAARDADSGVSHIQFYWHSNDWQSSNWISLGEDWDGSDGWTFTFKPPAGTILNGIAVYAVVYDWSGNWVGTGAWNLRQPMIYLPVVIKFR